MKRAAFSVSATLLMAGACLAQSQELQLLNDLRATENLPSVSYSVILQRAALKHAQDMHANDIFSHQGRDGSDVAQRVRNEGYDFCVVAENIAKGHRDLDEVFRAWMDSPGHRANIMSSEVTEFAVVEGRDSIWVMVLAAPGC
ncbi:MAG: CAP domain-containing protein [Roseobacter sp.]